MRFMSMVGCFVVFGLAVTGAAGGLSAGAAEPKGQQGAHAHPTEGPHGGTLIELGKEDYHAELVHDEAADTVTVYLLDGAAKEPVAIDAKQLSLNLIVGGKPQQFPLDAQPQSNDPAGKYSAFGSTSAVIGKALHAKGTTGRLNVTVAGKVFVGKLGAHTHPHPH
jgi:hypothetical protein